MIGKYNPTTGQIVTLASGVRLWVGTQSAHDTAVANGTMPNNVAVMITDDYPADGTDDYSTEETKTFKHWIDGKPIYRRVFTGLSINVTTSVWTSTPIVLTDCDTLVGVYIPAMSDLNDASSVTSNVVRTRMNKSTKAVLVATMNDSVTLTTICFEYTKTTD